MKSFIITAAIAAAIVPYSVLADDTIDISTPMHPMQALPIDVGGKRVVGYYEQLAPNCGLTLLLAEGHTAGEGKSSNPQGTRIKIPVASGKAVVIDGDNNRSAEFLCGPNGRKMNARTYSRASYIPAKT